ncbi:hypothetical protein Tco_0184425 [Tanacetum coccineum]
MKWLAKYASAPTANLPVIHDDTLLIPTDTPTISPIVPTIPSIAPTIQYTSLFICIDSSDSDTSERPPSQDSYEKITLHRIISPQMTHHEILCSPCDSPTAISAGLSRKRCRSPTSSIPVASPMRGALSLVRTDLLPPRKRIMDSDFMTDLEPDINPDVQADIDACIAFTDDIAARGMDVRVKIRTIAEEEAESSMRGMIEIGVDRVTHLVISVDIDEHIKEDFPELVSVDGSLEVMQRGLDVVMQELYDHMVEILVHRVRVIESVERDQGHRIVRLASRALLC